jgi:hypothetical protein
MYRAQVGSQVDRLVRAAENAQGAGASSARAQLQTLDERRLRRQPSERHAKRMSAFYADILPNGAGWSQPSDLDPQKCADEVIDAMNDYQGARQRIDEPFLFDDEELRRGLDALDRQLIARRCLS